MHSDKINIGQLKKIQHAKLISLAKSLRSTGTEMTKYGATIQNEKSPDLDTIQTKIEGWYQTIKTMKNKITLQG